MEIQSLLSFSATPMFALIETANLDFTNYEQSRLSICLTIFSLWQKYPGLQNYLNFKSPGPKVSRSGVRLAYLVRMWIKLLKVLSPPRFPV